MYYEVYDRFVKCGRPFHNTVVRCNYDIPMHLLPQIIELSLNIACKENKLYSAVDGFEAGLYRIKEKQEFNPTKDNICSLLENGNETTMFGIFPNDLSFYIRTYLEPSEAVAINETRGGWFELYGDDVLVAEVYEILKSKFDGFFIIESAKKHLEEIML